MGWGKIPKGRLLKPPTQSRLYLAIPLWYQSISRQRNKYVGGSVWLVTVWISLGTAPEVHPITLEGRRSYLVVVPGCCAYSLCLSVPSANWLCACSPPPPPPPPRSLNCIIACLLAGWSDLEKVDYPFKNRWTSADFRISNGCIF